MEKKPQTEILDFGDGSSATICVEDVGGGRYRIVDPVIAVCGQPLAFHDVIEAHRGDDERLVVHRRIESGNYRTFDYLLPAGWEERPSVKRILEKVHELGGECEGVFGRVLIICLPAVANYDPSNDIAEATRMIP